jgi:cystathionine beta-lyase
VRETIWENYRFAREELLTALPELVISPLEGTYLMWIDFSAYLKAEEMHAFMQKTCRLAFDYGEWFGGERFGTHVRVNLATSKELVREAVSRITANLPIPG